MNVKTLLFPSGFAIAFFPIACGDGSKKINGPGFNDSLLTTLFPCTGNRQLVLKNPGKAIT